MNTQREIKMLWSGTMLVFATVGALMLSGGAHACDKHKNPSAQQKIVPQSVALAMFGDEDKKHSHSVFVERIAGDDVEAHEIKIEIDNGEPKVWVNGKLVEGDRLRHEDGRIIVLDENGDEMRSVRIWDAGDEPFEWHGDMHFEMGDEPFAIQLQDDMAFDSDPPPVMLGVYMESPSPALRKHLKLKEGKATIITGVYEGLTAHAAGLEEFDIIVAIDGVDDAGPARLRDVLREREAGDPITLTFIHEGRRNTIEVELEAYDREKMHNAKLLGNASVSMRAKSEFVVSPFGPHENMPVFVSPDRDDININVDEINRVIENALRNAMRHAEDARQFGADELHERLRIDRDDVDQQMQKLHEHMEMIHRMMERMEKRLHTADDHDDKDNHDNDRDDDA